MGEKDDQEARIPDAVIPAGDGPRGGASHTGGTGFNVSFSFRRFGRSDYPVYGPPHDPGPPPISDGYVRYRPPPPERRWINYTLFALTFASTLLAGATQEAAPEAVLFRPLLLLKGIPFSLTLMAILLAHEMGHYLMAKRHGVDASLPYFIPFPSWIGTLGAVIKMRSPLHSREALLDIGAAGPIAGMLLAIPASYIGLVLSEVRPIPEGAGVITLGDSIIFKCFQYVIFGTIKPGHDVYLHPVALAGWIGMLVTMLNLLPVGQLDGGHIAYAIFGRRHDRVARAVFWVLLVLGAAGVLRMLGYPLGLGWPGWLVWAALLLFIIKLRHPPIHDEGTGPLDRKRMLIAWIALGLFVLTFTPSPVAGL